MSAETCEELLATIAQLALLEARELAADAERARQVAAEARDGAAAALHDAGWTVRKIGTELGVSHARAHQMVKAHRDRTWGGFSDTYSATPGLEQLAEEYRVARHAQVMRAEAAGGVPGNEEWRAFFGAENVAQADHTEAPLVWGSWLRHRAQMTEETA